MPVNFAFLCSLATLVIMAGLFHRLRRQLDLVALPATGDFRSCLCPPGPPFTPSEAPLPTSTNPFPPAAAGELILLVEDDASVRNLLSTVLLNHGYEVISARDGEEGLAFFQKHKARVALVITDVDLPRSSGRSLAELIRPLRPEVRILFMSGLDDNESATERSTDPFLLKPFKPAALLHTIHGLLHPVTPPA